MISVFYTCRNIACVSAHLMLFCSYVKLAQNKVYLILSYHIISYQMKHKCSELPALWGIHRWPVDSPYKGPVMRKSFPCHDVIMMESSREWVDKQIYRRNQGGKDRKGQHKQYNQEGIGHFQAIMNTNHTLLCFVVVWNGRILPISVMVISLAQGQSNHCPIKSLPLCQWSNLGKYGHILYKNPPRIIS